MIDLQGTLFIIKYHLAIENGVLAKKKSLAKGEFSYRYLFGFHFVNYQNLTEGYNQVIIIPNARKYNKLLNLIIMLFT